MHFLFYVYHYQNCTYLSHEPSGVGDGGRMWVLCPFEITNGYCIELPMEETDLYIN